MKFGRRAFLGFLGLQYSTFKAQKAAADLPEYDQPQTQSSSGWPALQGPTDESSTQIVFSIPKNINPTFVLKDNGREITVQPNQIFKEATSTWAQYHICLSGLKAKQDYLLEVFEGATKKDSRVFQTLSENGKDLKMAIISCMNDFFYKEESWDQLAKANPECIFMVGDSSYADFVKSLTLKPANKEQMWRRFMETRIKIKFYHSSRLTPVFAIWDDHDYGTNNGDRNFKYKNDAYQVWPAFFPRYENNIFKVGPGMASVVEFRNQRIFLLDNRSFRSTPGESNPAYFGAEQKQWVIDILNKKRRHTILLSGTQWFGGYRKKEGYEFAQPDLMKKFLNEIRKSKTTVLFGSGDIHMSEIMNVESDWLGYPTYEITSSAMHSLSGPGWSDRLDNPRRMQHVVASNFKILKLTAGAQYICELKCIKSNGNIAYETMLGVIAKEPDQINDPIDDLPV